MSEPRKYRKFSAQQKTELVLASLRGQRTVADLSRARDQRDAVCKWRERFLAAGAERQSGNAERTELDKLRGQIRRLERALARKTIDLEIASAGRRLTKGRQPNRGANGNGPADGDTRSPILPST